MIKIKSIPFLKILSPYVLGILVVFQFGITQQLHWIFLSAFIFLLITFIFQKFNKDIGYFKKAIYIVAINIFLFTLAFESCFLYNQKNNPNHYSQYITNKTQSFFVTVNDIPIVNKEFTKLKVTINSIQKNNDWHYAEGNTIVYIKQSDFKNLEIGDKLYINSKFSFLNEPKNPYEFNYKSFLEDRNVFHTVFVNPSQIYACSPFSQFLISDIGTTIKSRLVSILRNSGLSQEAFSICAALLVGYDDEIDNDVMQSFSHSGTLHILSVSGMHTGVLYGVLIFVFALFDKYDSHKKTKFIFVILFLWLFVLITGLSPSILRAALMLSLVLFGKTFYKQGNSYNTLLLSAFILLLYNPYLIKDVGFLLSYCAVFGIMYLYPILQKIYVFENKFLQNAWSAVLMSVAATLFTLPISLYFFHQFPIWFVFSNLIIIPISFVLMGGAALFLITYKIMLINQGLVFIINGATSIMLWLAQLTDDQHYGYVDFITFSKTDFLFTTILIFLFLMIVSIKQYKHVIAFCIVTIAWLFTSILSNYQDSCEKELIVFHAKRQSVFVLRLGNTVYGNFKQLNKKDFDRYVKPYLLSISSLNRVETESNFIKQDATTILNNDLSNQITEINPSYIIISNDVPLKLTTNYKTKPYVIADCTNSYKFTKKLKKQCALLDVPFYWVKESGAFRVNL